MVNRLLNRYFGTPLPPATLITCRCQSHSLHAACWCGQMWAAQFSVPRLNPFGSIEAMTQIAAVEMPEVTACVDDLGGVDLLSRGFTVSRTLSPNLHLTSLLPPLSLSLIPLPPLPPPPPPPSPHQNYRSLTYHQMMCFTDLYRSRLHPFSVFTFHGLSLPSKRVFLLRTPLSESAQRSSIAEHQPRNSRSKQLAKCETFRKTGFQFASLNLHHFEFENLMNLRLQIRGSFGQKERLQVSMHACNYQPSAVAIFLALHCIALHCIALHCTGIALTLHTARLTFWPPRRLHLPVAAP